MASAHAIWTLCTAEHGGMESCPMNEFGEPNMGNPSVRLDEGRERGGHWPSGLSTHPLPPTLQPGKEIMSFISGTYALPWPFGLGGGQERGGQLLVKAEKVFHALPLAGEGLGAVAQVHRPVQVRMGFDQRRRH